MRRTSLALLSVLLLPFLAGVAACAKNKTSSEAAPKTLSHRFDLKVGDKVVHMQLAVTGPEQERGLMGRRDLGPDDGMLFVYPQPQKMSFWMRNTPTPLDIGFFDADGVLREIYPMQPFDETSVSSRSDRIKYPLEMNQGWFRDNGVRPGARLDLKAVAEAVKARGFDPRQYRVITPEAAP